jgi:hypothetical protein
MSPDFGQHKSVVEATLARAGHTSVEGADRQNDARCLEAMSHEGRTVVGQRFLQRSMPGLTDLHDVYIPERA